MILLASNRRNGWWRPSPVAEASFGGSSAYFANPCETHFQIGGIFRAVQEFRNPTLLRWQGIYVRRTGLIAPRPEEKIGRFSLIS